MERTDLELVLAIRSAGSLSQAATALRLSAPVATKRLAALEAALGLKLFFRTTRRVAPTAEGDVLCDHAVGLLAQFEQAQEALREQASTPSGVIRLAATFGFGRIWLGPALADFSQLHPRVEVQVQLTEKLPDLSAQGFDAAVWLWSPSVQRQAQWSARKLAGNARVVVAAPAYLKAHGTPLSIADLAKHQCLVVRESEDPRYPWQLSQSVDAAAYGAQMQPTGSAQVLLERVEVKGALSSNSGELVRDWCLAGRGLMLRSLWDAAPLLASGQLVRVLANWAMHDADIQWLAPFRAQVPKRVKLLSDFLAARFSLAPWSNPPGNLGI
jgi:LysR family transcriptional regulator, transcriptional activator for dmlA